VIVDEPHVPAWWILADRSGTKVCIAAWPDGAAEELARD
jgi:4a-hydroxytetrahydrobiopterin dehydratase